MEGWVKFLVYPLLKIGPICLSMVDSCFKSSSVNELHMHATVGSFLKLMLVGIPVTLLSCQHLWNVMLLSAHILSMWKIFYVHCPSTFYLLKVSQPPGNSVLFARIFLFLWHFLHLNCRLWDYPVISFPKENIFSGY